jgi:ribose 1,5-bisphosphokinase
MPGHPKGRMVLVIGPSGAGKDTLLDYARERLKTDPTFRFVRRVVTRPPTFGEVFESVTEEAFFRRSERGEFSLEWSAHGHRYALPAVVHQWLAGGCVVIANGSRASLADARARFASLSVIGIRVSPGVLAARLANRGREPLTEQHARLARNQQFSTDGLSACEISNDGPVQEGGDALVRELRRIAGEVAARQLEVD